ncbi:MAG: RNA methyltransferase [Acidobacteriaceae bacterium]
MPTPPPITSKSNARVKALRASFSGKASQPGDLLGLEGEHLIAEAVRSGLRLEALFIRQGSENKLGRINGTRLGDTPRIILSPEVFDSALTTVSPQGLAAIWRIVEPPSRRPLRRVLILEKLQDPGNLGTLIRTFDAFGSGEIFATPGTVNRWNPKALRSSAGSAFRVPITQRPLSELADLLRGEGVRIFAAVPGFTHDGSKCAPHGVLYGRRVNAEASSPVYRDRTGKTIGSPNGVAQSLSFDADFDEPYAILVGNEGAGLSDEALALADEQVQIPGSTESLNAAVAGSLLLYEAMRQLPLRAWAHKQGLRP